MDTNKVKVEVTQEGAEIFGIDTKNFKVGQKYPTPSPGSGDRVFYETLYLQKPESEMAQEYCLYYGILTDDEARKVNELVINRKKKSSSSGKASSSLNIKVTAVKTSRRSNRTVDNDVDDEDFDGGWETRGKSKI